MVRLASRKSLLTYAFATVAVAVFGASCADPTPAPRAIVLSVTAPFPSQSSNVSSGCGWRVPDEVSPAVRKTDVVCSIELRVGADVPDAAAVEWWYRVADRLRLASPFSVSGQSFSWYVVDLRRLDAANVWSVVTWLCPGDVSTDWVSIGDRSPFAPGFTTPVQAYQRGCRLGPAPDGEVAIRG